MRGISGFARAALSSVAGVAVVGLLGALMWAPSAAVATHDGAMTDRFAREVALPGDRDRSTYSIDHVRELQLRLRREGVLRRQPTGRYGTATRNAVARLQRRHELRPSGVATRATWRVLLQRSNVNMGAAARRCDGRGWHACYDRRNHQLTLWRNGRLWNSWLVRGGSSRHKTRTGDFPVFRRHKRHVSSIFDSPMPYSQFFSGGQALHGSRNMMDPYRGHSHGCVNMYVEDARQLWNLTHHRRLQVHVYGRWS